MLVSETCCFPKDGPGGRNRRCLIYVTSNLSELSQSDSDMAVFLRDTPIKRKLMLVILLTNGFALLLMGSALITYETGHFPSLARGRTWVCWRKSSARTAPARSPSRIRRSAQEILARFPPNDR